jgi:hypothetical protein
MTLLEVLVALGIFLTALTAISRLVTIGGDHALEVQQQAQATQLCQAKLAEVISGIVPLSGQNDVPFDEDPNWLWSVDAEQGTITGLWKITVRVSRQRVDGSRIECALDRLLLDPSLRGSTLDAATLAANSASNSSSNSSNSPTSSGSSTPTGSNSSTGTSGAKPTTGGASSGGSGSSPKPTSGASTPSSSGAKPATGNTPSPSSSGAKGTSKGGS